MTTTRPASNARTTRRRSEARQRVAFSMPLPLAARVAALCEMHPGRARSEILVDLLRMGLSEVERAASTPTATTTIPLPAGPLPVYLREGPFPEFHRLLVKHHRRLERELAGEDPEPPAAPDAYDLNDDA